MDDYLTRPLVFLVQVGFGLYSLAVLLRFLLQYVGAQTQPINNPQRYSPKVIIKIQDHPGAVMGKRLYFFQQSLHIPQIVNQIGKNDDIKLALDRQLVGIGPDKTKIRILGGGLSEHRTGKINPDTHGRFQTGQQITVSAAKLEYP